MMDDQFKSFPSKTFVMSCFLNTYSVFSFFNRTLLIALNVSALENVRFVLDQNGKAFALYMNSQVKQAIDIRIQDKSGYILWEDNFQAKGKVTKRFSFDKLPDGNYFARVSDHFKTIIQPFTVRGGTVNIVEKDRTIRYKPVISQDGRRLDINWFTAGEKVSIRLTDLEGNVLWQEQQREGTTLHKRYNLDQIPAGTYILNMFSRNAQHFQEIICK
jgi:hypothetical protein